MICLSIRDTARAIMARITKLLLVLMLGLVAVALAGAPASAAKSGGLEPAPDSAVWPIQVDIWGGVVDDAAIYGPEPRRMEPDDPGYGEPEPRYRRVGKVTFSDTHLRRVVPTATVLVGPFNIEHSGLRDDDFSDFSISVLARSPALYVNGKFVGADEDFQQIGHWSSRLSGWRESTRELFIPVTLPSVVTALKLRVAVNSFVKEFPAGCNSLPASTGDPEALDAPCMQIAVNPLAVVVPHIIPLSIIYEPPGNCSWANLTREHTAGTAITVQEEQSTSTQTIHDVSAFGFTLDKSNVTETKVSEKNRTSLVRVLRKRDMGTALGASSNPGDPRCNEPGNLPPPRPLSGPGLGDIFILLLNAPLIYWDTANLSNFVFGESNPPGVEQSMMIVSALQLWNDDLPIPLTYEERMAILSLDPFFVPPPPDVNLIAPPPTLRGSGLLPDLERRRVRSPPSPRFVYLDSVNLGRNQHVEQTVGQMMMTEHGVGLTQWTKKQVTETETDPFDALHSFLAKLYTKALAYGGGKAAGAAAEKLVPGSGASVEEEVKSNFPELYKEKTDTTVIMTLSRNTLIEKTNANAITQNFHVRDTNRPMNVDLYYDTLFGTFAFISR